MIPQMLPTHHVTSQCKGQTREGTWCCLSRRTTFWRRKGLPVPLFTFIETQGPTISGGGWGNKLAFFQTRRPHNWNKIMKRKHLVWPISLCTTNRYDDRSRLPMIGGSDVCPHVMMPRFLLMCGCISTGGRLFSLGHNMVLVLTWTWLTFDLTWSNTLGIPTAGYNCLY